jgi:hypothetical protein
LSDLAELPAGVEDERAALTLALALSDRYQYAIGGVAAFIKAREELVNFAQQVGLMDDDRVRWSLNLTVESLMDDAGRAAKHAQH